MVLTCVCTAAFAASPSPATLPIALMASRRRALNRNPVEHGGLELILARGERLRIGSGVGGGGLGWLHEN